MELTVNKDGVAEEDISSLRSIPKPFIPSLHFNRPFIMLIPEGAGHNLLFMGKVMNPIST